jgi:hypothetical protein
MKPTTTNCQECWLDGQREVPATWVTKDGDFLCDAHLRAQAIDPMSCTAMEKWKAEHGVTVAPEKKEAAMPRGIPKTGRTCKTCPRHLRSDSTGDMCAKCRSKAEKKLNAPATTVVRRKTKTKEHNAGNGNGHAAARVDTVEFEVVAAVRLLDLAWHGLDCAQKARALATVLAE